MRRAHLGHLYMPGRATHLVARSCHVALVHAVDGSRAQCRPDDDRGNNVWEGKHGEVWHSFNGVGKEQAARDQEEQYVPCKREPGAAHHKRSSHGHRQKVQHSAARRRPSLSPIVTRT